METRKLAHKELGFSSFNKEIRCKEVPEMH
jgi:hypothetical protein